MKIAIASKNQAKVGALEEIIRDYPLFSGAQVVSCEVETGVSEQPCSFMETVKGARNRARRAFEQGKDWDYGFGIESGLIQLEAAKTGHMDITVCAIYDGEEYHLGTSSCFEYPREVTRLILEEGLDVSEASRRLGLTDKEKVGNEEGTIGILTKGRLDRKGLTKQAIMMALIHLENRELF